MPTAGQPPVFRGKAVAVQFDTGIPNARIVMAGINGLVRRVEDGPATEDDFVTEFYVLIDRYGYDARLTGRTAEAIEFRVTER